MIVTCQNLHKVYRLDVQRSLLSWMRRRGWRSVRALPELTALADVSFTIAPGEAVGLIGSNGSGKSTLLKLIGGITEPTAGTIRTCGRVAAILDLGAGLVDEMTAQHNVELHGQLLGLSRRDVRTLLPEIFDFSELAAFADVPLRQFSLGMRLRLAFSISLATRPDLLVLDEVMAVGDFMFQRKSSQRILELARQGTTVLLVSHHHADLTLLCRRGLHLSNGRLVADGPIHDVLRGYVSSREPRVEAHATDAHGLPSAPRPAELLGVRVLDGAGQPCEERRVGETFAVAIQYRVQAGAAVPVFGFDLYRDDGLFVGWADTREGGLHTLAPSGEVSCRIEAPVLGPGRYLITAAMVEPTAVHHFPGQAAFTIVGEPGRMGAVRLATRWVGT